MNFCFNYTCILNIFSKRYESSSLAKMTARLKCKNTTTVAGLTMLLRFYDSTIKIYSLYFVECTRKFQNGWKWKRYGVRVCFRFEIRLACVDYRRREESGRLPGEKRCNLDLAFFFKFPVSSGQWTSKLAATRPRDPSFILTDRYSHTSRLFMLLVASLFAFLSILVFLGKSARG